MYVSLVPYCTDYKNGKQAREAWNNGADFLIQCIGHPYDGKPINKEQADETNDKYSLRFNKLRGSCNV